MQVGVLALQGAVREHVRTLQRLGVAVGLVRQPEDLFGLDALVLPGGESTAMRRLMDMADLLQPLREFSTRKPVLATCAGAILLAQRIAGQDGAHLGLLDVTIERNAYGSQLDSFQREGVMSGVGSFPMVLIRAPLFSDLGPGVEVLAELDGQIIAVRQQQLLALSFHPEMTDDLRVHQFFLNMVAQAAPER